MSYQAERRSVNWAFIKARTMWVFAIIIFLYLALAGRFVYVHVIGNKEYVSWAKKRVRSFPLSAKRGAIFDRKGRPLASDIETVAVFANMREVENVNDLLDGVTKILGFNRARMSKKLTKRKGIVYLAKNVDPRYADLIVKNRSALKGVGFERRSKRVYSSGHLAAQVLGFTDIDNKGIEGLECSLNKLLKGEDGKITAELDSRHRMIPETRHVVREPVDGKNIYLTIDTTIQHISERALASMAQKYTPEHAIAIVMDPHTGEILACANYPTYDANNARQEQPKYWRNRAVADLYEPGSTQKVFTLAAALDMGYRPNQVFAYCTGKEKIGGGRIPCLLHHPYEKGHGAVDMPMIIKQSCNIGAAHVALKLGGSVFYKYEEAFGFTKKIDAGFGSEAVGWVRKPGHIRKIELANSGFGQGLAVTPMHMATGYCVLANGGTYLQPQVIREIRGHDGTIYQEFQKKALRKVISKSAADEIVDLMVQCVEDGTGKPAAIPGRQVAGKTGSAQIAKINGRGYEEGAFVSSFMGCAPAKNARLVIAVAVFKPKGSHWGATVAAPVFKEIGEKALWYLKVPADKPTSIPRSGNALDKMAILPKGH